MPEGLGVEWRGWDDYGRSGCGGLIVEGVWEGDMMESWKSPGSNVYVLVRVGPNMVRVIYSLLKFSKCWPFS